MTELVVISAHVCAPVTMRCENLESKDLGTETRLEPRGRIAGEAGTIESMPQVYRPVCCWGTWWGKRWPADVGAWELTRTLAEISAHRPLAYSTLADLVHHVRQHLPLSDLSLAVQLFAKNIDDESLPSSIQTMSCKLLLNLVDCIRSKSEQESGNGRDVLMRMLEVPVLRGVGVLLCHLSHCCACALLTRLCCRQIAQLDSGCQTTWVQIPTPH